jgi:hypothetical protein
MMLLGYAVNYLVMLAIIGVCSQCLVVVTVALMCVIVEAMMNSFIRHN